MAVRWYLGVLCAGMTLYAGPAASQAIHAGPGPVSAPSVTYGVGRGVVNPGSYNQVGAAFRTWAANSSGVAGEVLVKDAARVAVGNGAANATMYATRVLTWPNVALAAGRALPYVAAGSLIWSVFDALRCRQAAGSNTPSISCDEGLPSVEGAIYTYNYTHDTAGQGPTTGTATSLAAASNAVAAAMAQDRTSSFGTGTSATTIQTTISVGACTQATTTWSCNLNAHEVRTQATTPNATVTTRDYVAQASGNKQVGQVCPDGTVPMRDGKCSGGSIVGKTAQDIADKLQQFGDKSLAPQIAPAAAPYTPLDPLLVPKPLTGPNPVTGTPVTTVTQPNPTPGNPNPAPITKVETPKWDITYPPDVPDTWTETPGTIVTDANGTTTTTGKEDAITCGLPGTPKCAIDEAGTKTEADNAAANAALTAAQAARVKEISDSAKNVSLPWTWNLGLPVGACVPITLWTPPDRPPLKFDPCNSPGVNLFRSLMAWFLAALTGLHIWRTVQDLRGE